MSMELHVLLSKSRLPDVPQWQAAVDELGYDLKLDPDFFPHKDRGFRPCTFRGRRSGFEFYTDPASDTAETYTEFEKQFAGYDLSADFRWGGDLTEMACVLIASAALAKLCEGVWFDPQEGACLSPDEAVEQIRSEIAAAELSGELP